MFLLHLFAARHHHHRHPFAKKLTHSNFPSGGYILVHYPLAHHIFASNQNELVENSLNSESNDLPNDILMHDVSPPTSPPIDSSTLSRRHNASIKNKYNMKFKRNADADKFFIEPCCSHSSQNSCSKLYCRKWKTLAC